MASQSNARVFPQALDHETSDPCPMIGEPPRPLLLRDRPRGNGGTLTEVENEARGKSAVDQHPQGHGERNMQ
eukprot:1315166-Pyramimonas_sp.AAC.1